MKHGLAPEPQIKPIKISKLGFGLWPKELCFVPRMVFKRPVSGGAEVDRGSNKVES